MSLTLYQATVPTFIQIAGATRQILDKAEAHCAEHGVPPESLVEARLIEDMWTFAFQIKSVRTHTARALQTLMEGGTFSPPDDPLATDFAGLKATVDEALEYLAAVDEDELENCAERIVPFAAGSYKFDFTAQNFLLSFAQPNLFFHATTAYDILRARGVEIGKIDFLGALRVQPG
ncbi:DUF1993 domain-containing protein [Mangrovimicrobium sediminis]|nr:DUF1993 domain-containing protein [Haliea sp. SAOS-164]